MIIENKFLDYNIQQWKGTCQNNEWTLLCGDAALALQQLDDQSVNCIITSPPYYSLRDYGVNGQIGLEETVNEYINALSAVMDQAYRVLKKDGLLFLNLGDTFEEPGYYASRAYYDMTKQVLIEDNINTNKIGSYKVTYTIYYQGQAYQKIRYVTVLDQTPPTITLKGNTTVTVCPNKKYQEEGYESIDNYDGDLTKEVETEINKDFIQYSVKDHSGNFTSIKRFIKYEDNEAPIITLHEGNAYSLYIGESYKEPGFQAIDNCDGDITKKVIVNSNLDTNKKGTYEINY